MRSQFMSMFGIAAALMLSATSAPVSADVVNTHGSICQNYNAADISKIDFLMSGVRVIGAASASVICAVPRTALDTGASSGDFVVDFTLAPNASITCTLYSYDRTQDSMLGSQAFSRSNLSTDTADFDVTVTLPNFDLPTVSFTTLLCTLPAAPSKLRGIVARPFHTP